MNNEKVERPLHFDKDDEQKLLKRRSKREDGMVYAHVNGVSGFYHISKIPINELDGKTVIEYIKDINSKLDKKNKQVETLKEVIQHDREKIRRTEVILEKYGLQ